MISVPDFDKTNFFSCYQNEFYKFLYFGILSGINNIKTEGKIQNSELKNVQAIS